MYANCCGLFVDSCIYLTICDCSPSCFDPDLFLLVYLWLGLSWIGCISTIKDFPHQKQAAGTLHQQQAAGEAQQTHSVETTIKPSPSRPSAPRTERGPYAAPGDAPDRERCPAGAHQPGGSPLRSLDGVAHVEPVRPAPVHGEHSASDGRGVRHVPPQQRPSPAARPQDALPRRHSPVPGPGAGHVGGRSV